MGKHAKSEFRVVTGAALLISFLAVFTATHFSPKISAWLNRSHSPTSAKLPPEILVTKKSNHPEIILSADVKQIPFKAVQPIWDSVIYLSRNSAADAAAGSGVIVHFDPSTHAALVITAAHVVRCQHPETNCHLHAYFPVQGSFVAVEVQILNVDLKSDEALLQVQVPDTARIAVASLRPLDVKANRKIIAIGFPNLELRADKSWGRKKPEGPGRYVRRFSTGKLLASTTSRKLGSALIHYADVLPGDSGGGLFDSSGYLIGILTQIEYKNAEAAHAKPICTERSELCRNVAHTISMNLLNINQTVASAQKSASQKL